MSVVRRRVVPVLGALASAALLCGLTTAPAPTVRATVPGPAVERVEHAHGVQVRRARVVTGTVADRTAYTGGRIRISGTAVTEKRHGRARSRTVRVVERLYGRWKRVESTRTDRDGAWSVVLAAGTEPRTRTFRAEVNRSRGLRAGTSPSIDVDVVAPPATDPAPTTPAPTTPPVEPATAGQSGDWTYLFDGGSRWNPCTEIRWAYNPNGQGYDALPDIQQAFARIAAASGLRFRYVGATQWRYRGAIDDASGFPASTADIAVGWANQSELPALAGNTVGYGGASGWTVRNADVRYRLYRGYLVLDNGHALPTGFDKSGWGQIELHEILHSLGLGHAASSNQLMYGTASSRNLTFGAGDLAGMARIGSPAGCLS
ncbi:MULTISPECIES: hypothetical protein [unclassified Nocardioides]|uniref:hypothetical protein n=1 Tax=unclassified Nocardioides TaxID=2615069 RepID=UPI0036104B3E